MAARLPIPGSDDGHWGDILNDFLKQAHDPDTGLLKPDAVSASVMADGSVGTAKIQDGAVTAAKLSATAPGTGQVLSYDGSNLAWTNAGGGGDPAMGGDLTGTASNAQLAAGVVGVTELASNAVTTTKITDGNVTNTKLADGAVTSAKLSGGAVTTAAVVDNAITEAKLDTAVQTKLNSVSNSITVAKGGTGAGTRPTVNFIEGSNVTITATDDAANDRVNVSISSTGSGGAADASTSAKGIVQLAGDLAGAGTTAAAPVISDSAVSSSKIANSAVTTAKIADTNVTTGKLADDSVTAAKLADASVDATKLSTSLAPTNGQVLSYNGTSMAWVNAASGNPSMGGDLSGTASNAQIVAGAVGVTELADNTVTTAKIADASVTGTKIAADTITDANISGSAAIAVSKISGLQGSLSTIDTQMTGKAAKGANSDITSLSGLTTPLSVAQGGTGNTSGRGLIDVAKSGTTTGTRNKLNFIQGSNVTITTVDDSTNGKVDITIAAAGGGGGGYTPVNKTANYTATASDWVICNASGAGFTVTLPSPAAGANVRVTKTDATSNAIIVMGNGNSTLAGSVSYSVNSPWMSQDFCSDGTNWYCV